MKHNLSEQVNLLMEQIDAADAVCVGAVAGMSVAAGYERWAFFAAAIYMDLELPDGEVYENLTERIDKECISGVCA